MSPTPTRADVLREFAYCDCSECTDAVRERMADEILRLREQWDATIRRVEALKPGDWITREDLLAALRDGGTDGQ